MLESEWETIDTAVRRLDISAKLTAEINDHIYLKFRSQEFECQKNASISLPVSVAVSVLLCVIKIISA